MRERKVGGREEQGGWKKGEQHNMDFAQGLSVLLAFPH